MIDYYGDDANYIHLKFGNMRKMYNFTEEFIEKHPNFCAEYAKYWEGDETCKFEYPLQIINYVDHYNIPVNFYFNYTDTPAKNNEEVKQYLVRESVPRDYAKFFEGKWVGWDGEKEAESKNLNMDVYNYTNAALGRLGFEAKGGGDTSDGGIEETYEHKSGYKVKVTQYGVDEEK